MPQNRSLEYFSADHGKPAYDRIPQSEPTTDVMEGAMTCPSGHDPADHTGRGALSDRELDDGVRSLLEKGEVIEAIKLCRENRPWSLKEARDHVAARASEMGMTIGGGASGLTCPLLGLVALTWVVLMVFIPILVHRLVEGTTGPLSAGASAGIYAGTALLLLALTIVGTVMWARRSSSVRRESPGSGPGY